MAITKQQTPYEFLVRWTNGTVAGAHIRFLERLVDDGTVLSEKEGNAHPVSMAGEVGFPIADILDAVQIAALTDLVAAQVAKTEAVTSLKTAQDALAASEAKVAQLQAKIDAYTPPVPASVTVVSMRQARLALNAAGLLASVEAAVARSTDEVKIEWEYSSELRRDWPTLALLAGALGLTDQQLDALFAQATAL